jgi:hypothetical protein
MKIMKKIMNNAIIPPLWLHPFKTQLSFDLLQEVDNSVEI